MAIRNFVLVGIVAIGPAAAGGCGGEGQVTTMADRDAATAAEDASRDATTIVSVMRLPLGDGKYLPAPKQGYVFSCKTTFMTGMGGAFADGPWIHHDTGTFDFTAKTVVQGEVRWPAHAFTAMVTGATRTITGNGLPDHTTGTFPIAPSDPAYAYDRNPNTIAAQTNAWSLPANPAVAATETCLGGGPIGVLLSGAVFFDALDAEGRDAVAHETQDACQAHPAPSGAYHYHSLSTCLPDSGSGHSALLGYARDGFGIFGVRGEGGQPLTNADLDVCHGHTHEISWDGSIVSLYHYHATYEYPYTLGCFRGAVP